MVFSCPPSFRQKVIRAFLAHSSGVNRCPFIFYYCSPPFALSLFGSISASRSLYISFQQLDPTVTHSMIKQSSCTAVTRSQNKSALFELERLVLSSRMGPSMRDYVQMWGCCMPHVNSGHIMRMMLWTTYNSGSRHSGGRHSRPKDYFSIGDMRYKVPTTRLSFAAGTSVLGVPFFCS